MVARAPPVMRLSRMSGVRPMLSALSSNLEGLDFPVGDIVTLPFCPLAGQFREVGMVDDAGNGVVDMAPHFGERRFGAAPGARLAVGAFDDRKSTRLNSSHQ